MDGKNIKVRKVNVLAVLQGDQWARLSPLTTQPLLLNSNEQLSRKQAYGNFQANSCSQLER